MDALAGPGLLHKAYLHLRLNSGTTLPFHLLTHVCRESAIRLGARYSTRLSKIPFPRLVLRLLSISFLISFPYNTVIARGAHLHVM